MIDSISKRSYYLKALIVVHVSYFSAAGPVLKDFISKLGISIHPVTSHQSLAVIEFFGLKLSNMGRP